MLYYIISNYIIIYYMILYDIISYYTTPCKANSSIPSNVNELH